MARKFICGPSQDTAVVPGDIPSTSPGMTFYYNGLSSDR